MTPATPAHPAPGEDERWGWDLGKGEAVRWKDRGPGEQVLGPYPSRSAAEHWRETVETRNTAWEEWEEREPD